MTDSSQLRVIDSLTQSSLSHSRAILTQSAQHCVKVKIGGLLQSHVHGAEGFSILNGCSIWHVLLLALKRPKNMVMVHTLPLVVRHATRESLVSDEGYENVKRTWGASGERDYVEH